jgi:hypothetical protein
MGHAGRLNDLLGLSFIDLHPDSGIRYVLNHPGVVVTSFACEYDPVGAAQVEQDAARLHKITEELLAVLPG